MIDGTLSVMARVLPPLKPIHPNQRMITPATDRGMFEPGIFTGAPFFRNRITSYNVCYTKLLRGTEQKYSKGVIQTMQYLIIDQGRGVLLDPGGVHLFSRVVAAVSRYISIDKIDHIFFSHQDPDVSSGIALWLGVTKAKVHISSLWTRFLPHFGIVDSYNFV